MGSIRNKVLRRTLVGILLAACCLYISGYIVLDIANYTRTLPMVSIVPKTVLQPRYKEPHDVLILAYMRSGSSFIGKLIGARKDTFYWYEPLWKTHKWSFLSTGQMVCNFRKGCSNDTGSASSTQQSLKFLLDIYKCNLKEHFHRFDQFIAEHVFFKGARDKVSQECSHPVLNHTCLQMDFKNCSPTNPKCYKDPLKSLENFYYKWIKLCNTSTHRATKVIRMETEHAQYLLENHKQLKLIQIFRDPRAIINSRKKTGWYYTNFGGYSMIYDAKILCERMEKDMVSAEKLKSLYPDRVKIIQYEDFYDPNRTAINLYDFLNMNMTKYASRILRRLHATKAKKSHFHPESYRFKLHSSFILATNIYCKKVFQNLGLRVFNSASEITNNKVNVIVDKLPYPL